MGVGVAAKYVVPEVINYILMEGIAGGRKVTMCEGRVEARQHGAGIY